MECLVERCAGIDIGKADLKACVRTPNPAGKRSRRQEIRTYATTTNSLLELRDWERAIGLDAIGPRVVMRRELSA